MTYRDDQVAAWQGHFSPLVLEKVTLGVIVTRFLSFEWASENGQFLVAYFSRLIFLEEKPINLTLIPRLL